MLSPRQFFFTVDVEEWFTSTKIISVGDNKEYKVSSDIPETIHWLLNVLKKEGIPGTFFFIYDIALRYPYLVQEIIKNGHEIALHGETHDSLDHISNGDFKQMLHRMKDYFQKNFKVCLRGYRAPYFSINKETIALLKSSDFFYDSSVVPCLPIPGWYGVRHAPLIPYQIGDNLAAIDLRSQFLEFPLSVHPTLRLPGLGGYYFRNLGFHWAVHLIKICLKKLGYVMFYLHPWELSSSIPKIKNMPFYVHYRTGEWTRNALIKLLKIVKHSFRVKPSTLFDFYQKYYR